jgi:hypothetical protein
MPRMDGTGPMGAGAMTGRGLGRCDSENVAEARTTPTRGYGMGYIRGCGRGFARGAGRGMGLGRGRGMGRGFAAGYVNPENRKDLLQRRKDILQERLSMVNEQLENL